MKRRSSAILWGAKNARRNELLREHHDVLVAGSNPGANKTDAGCVDGRGSREVRDRLANLNATGDDGDAYMTGAINAATLSGPGPP